MALKVMLISIMVLVVLFIITKVVANTLTPEEKLIGLIKNVYPMRATVLTLLLIVSFIETVISVICWIVVLGG